MEKFDELRQAYSTSSTCKYSNINFNHIALISGVLTVICIYYNKKTSFVQWRYDDLCSKKLGEMCVVSI